MTRLTTLIIAAAILPSLSGCIAWEIRDDIRTTNQHLCEVKPSLVHTLHAVEQTRHEIERTQQQLAAVQSQLAEVRATILSADQQIAGVGQTLGTTNPKLTNLDGGLERMRILNQVQESLDQTNAALGPLSKAMGSLGGAMSFLGMGGGGSGDVLAAEEAADGGDGDEAGGESGQDRGRLNPLLGAWLLVYPPPAVAPPQAENATAAADRITVILADGRLLVAEQGHPPRTGRWNRQGRSLTLSLDTPEGAPADSRTLELLTLNSRTMTVRAGDELRVYSRP